MNDLTFNDIDLNNIASEENTNISENTTINENTTTLENTILASNTTNVTIEQANTLVDMPESASLDTIHNDLGIICTFLILFSLVIVIKYIYKFFNMFF